MTSRLLRSLSASPAQNTNQLVSLVKASLIPLHVVLVGLTWILHDYFLTLEDEIRYIWPQRRSFSKFMFFWIRYYSIALLLFDVIQIHVFARPGFTSDNLCIAMDTIIRVVGAISLWSVEIIMQLRIYALFECSKPIAFLNLTLFAGSIAGFMWILIHNHSRRASVIASVIDLPLPGCPSVHSGIEWAQWVPATIFEGILFLFALFKTFERTVSALRKEGKVRLYRILLRDNILYFFGVAALLVFNNLMVVSVTHIPWFSYGPFHAAVGIMTSRMLINLRKATSKSLMISAGRLGEDGETLRFTDSSTLY
ncbi:UBA-e1-C domain-containing protein [Favolaschia claudopus]|uniref:UBA-e1-C domain-containing protein n=1 Tax=Favolaschia claudopus TaxID=2862362 RepID=A0AAW0CBY0_9AGAR